MPPTAASIEQIAKARDLDVVDADAGAARGLGVAAHGVDVTAEPRAGEQVRANEVDASEHEQDVRDAAVLIADVDHRQ
jgi:hypothetical protein